MCVIDALEGLRAAVAAADAGPDGAEARGGGGGGVGVHCEMCVVCLERPRSTRLLPCHHAILCVTCAAAVLSRASGCPHCRAPLRTFEEGNFDRTFVP